MSAIAQKPRTPVYRWRSSGIVFFLQIRAQLTLAEGGIDIMTVERRIELISAVIAQ